MKKATYGPKAISIPHSAKYGAGTRKSGAHKRNNGTTPGRVGKRVAAAPPPKGIKPSFRSSAAGVKKRPPGKVAIPSPRKMPAGRNINVKRGSPVPPPKMIIYKNKPEVMVRLSDDSRTVGNLLSGTSTGSGKTAMGQYSIRLSNGKTVTAVKSGTGFRVMHGRVKG